MIPGGISAFSNNAILQQVARSSLEVLGVLDCFAAPKTISARQKALPKPDPVRHSAIAEAWVDESYRSGHVR